jgi:hypothetical protein
MNNSQLKNKPFYIKHREVDGTPVAAETTDLAALLVANPRSTADTAGFKTIKGFVRLTGGASPTITLQPLELVKLSDGTSFLAVTGANTAALASGDAFDITTNSAFLFLRIHAVANNPTKAEIFIAGAESLPRDPGEGRI